MLKIGETIMKNVNLKPKSFNIDNLVFRLHYRITCWLILAFVGILCVEEYNKAKIMCTHSDSTDSKKQLEHVINNYCFFMSTFTVPRHHNKSSGNTAHPGVGPSEQDETVITHWYYQWVPYVLFFQAVSFYIPHFIWRNKEGHRLSNLVEGFNIVKMLQPNTRKDQHTKVEGRLKNRLPIYRSWLGWLVTCEILNLLNLILQTCLTNLFLGGQFWRLGSLVYEHYGSEQFNPLDMVFPKVSKCTFQKYGPSGSLQTQDVACVLSLNIINEKIYLVLWYWYILLAIASVLALFHRALSYGLYSSNIKYNVRVFAQEMTMKPRTSDLMVLMKNLSYSEWFFLQCLATNLDGKLATDLLTDLANDYRKKEKAPLLSPGDDYENAATIRPNEKTAPVFSGWVTNQNETTP